MQLIACSVESSDATQSTWLLPRPPAVSRRMWLTMWTTASRCGPMPSAHGGRDVAAGATLSTIRPSSVSRSYSLSTTAPATAPRPRPRCPARLDRLYLSCATTRTGCYCPVRPVSRRNMPTVDYSETHIYGLSEMSFKPAKWRGRGL